MNAATELRQVIAERLRELMAASPDLDTQVKLAHRSGLSQSSVARILSADSSATVDSIANLARAFGIPPAFLLLSNKVDVELLLTSQALTPEARQRLLGYAAALITGEHVSTNATRVSGVSRLRCAWVTQTRLSE
ncbi:helix-turn-helix domain-containing protein [Roseateles sp.]|jgi:transcriptional regulator with XRE-family HTH domain|uniref:helix-turn-helix domain-containing protein n=1 Tax=Roseateles sp. TaxID=1971397 RepID=UPI003BA400CB